MREPATLTICTCTVFEAFARRQKPVVLYNGMRYVFITNPFDIIGITGSGNWYALSWTQESCECPSFAISVPKDYFGRAIV